MNQAKLLDRITGGVCVGGGAVDCNNAALIQVRATFVVLLRGEPRVVTFDCRMCSIHAPKAA